MGNDNTARRLNFEIFRYNPQDPDSVPHTDHFETLVLLERR